MMRLETPEACEAFVLGCAFYGVGGGGDPERGLRILLDAVERGLSLQWTPADELDEDMQVACAWGMGSIAPQSPERREKMRRLGLDQPVETESMQRAIREMEDFTGEKIGAVIALEPGGINTPNPLVTAAKMGLPLIDGDLAGRAIPEVIQTLPVVAGSPFTPMTSVDGWGNTCIIRETYNEHLAERIGKLLAESTYGSTHMCGFVQPIARLRHNMVAGTVSKCLQVGHSILGASKAGTDPVRALREATEARVIFEGQVQGKDWKNEDGYMVGTSDIAGSGNYRGRSMKIWYKNEHHISWLDGQPHVTSPDLLSIVTREDGRPVTNTNLLEGMDVVVLALPCDERFRSPRGLHLLGPRHFGFDIDYVPMEERLDE